MNARSVANNNKVEEIAMYALENSLDIIGVAESWLNENILDSEVAIDGYTLFRKDRNRLKPGRGGGVLLYIRNNLNCVECPELNTCSNESVWCKLLLDENEIFVGIVYRSPNSENAENESLIATLNSLSNK